MHLKEAFISTFSGDHPITIIQENEGHFIFTAGLEIPIGVKLFLKDPELIQKGVIKLPAFKIIEKNVTENCYQYEAIMERQEFDFEEWEKSHRRSPERPRLISGT